MQDFGQPPAGPTGDFFDGLFFKDPFEAMASAFDNPAALPFWNDRGISPLNPDHYMDDLARNLGALEENIERTALPLPEFEGPPLSLEPPEHITQDFLGEGPPLPPETMMQGYVSDGPPLPPEPADRQWTALKPPLPARPYFTPDGLTTSSYRPSGRVGTGARNSSQDHDGEQYCPADDDWVPQENCQSCTYYDPEATTCKHHNSKEKS